MGADTFFLVVMGAIIAITALGGMLSLFLERLYQRRYPDWSYTSFHGAKWDKQLNIQPRHELCGPCEEEVRKVKEYRERRNAARRS